MNNSDIHNNDSLHDLFNQLPVEEPSLDFNQKVMNEVNLHVKKQHLLKAFAEYFTASISGVLLIILSVLVFYFLGIKVDLKSMLPAHVQIGGLSISISIVSLLLLVADMCIRRWKLMQKTNSK